MANDNISERNLDPNTNKQNIEQQKLKAEQVQDETGYRRVPIDVNDKDKQKELIDLAWYLGIANAVSVKAKIKLNKLVNGKKQAYEVQKAVFDHFEFPAVGTQKFEEWVQEKFGADVKVDPKTKEVYTLVPEGDNAPAPQPETNNTEETQPQPAPEQNPNDPENN